jgi:chromosomal replication initiation ATPase DnaA
MSPTATTPETQDRIIAEVAYRMGVSDERLRARDRTPQVAAARHAAFWALQEAGLTPAQIARLWGLHHSTVVHGLARA